MVRKNETSRAIKVEGKGHLQEIQDMFQGRTKETRDDEGKEKEEEEEEMQSYDEEEETGTKNEKKQKQNNNRQMRSRSGKQQTPHHELLASTSNPSSQTKL